MNRKKQLLYRRNCSNRNDGMNESSEYFAVVMWLFLYFAGCCGAFTNTILSSSGGLVVVSDCELLPARRPPPENIHSQFYHFHFFILLMFIPALLIFKPLNLFFSYILNIFIFQTVIFSKCFYSCYFIISLS